MHKKCRFVANKLTTCQHFHVKFPNMNSERAVPLALRGRNLSDTRKPIFIRNIHYTYRAQHDHLFSFRHGYRVDIAICRIYCRFYHNVQVRQCFFCLFWLMGMAKHMIYNKYRLKRKEKNKSREEIFYQMKVFFVKIDQLQIFVNRPGAHN